MTMRPTSIGRYVAACLGSLAGLHSGRRTNDSVYTPAKVRMTSTLAVRSHGFSVTANTAMSGNARNTSQIAAISQPAFSHGSRVTGGSVGSTAWSPSDAGHGRVGSLTPEEY
jgi:hypothetical protein